MHLRRSRKEIEGKQERRRERYDGVMIAEVVMTDDAGLVSFKGG